MTRWKSFRLSIAIVSILGTALIAVTPAKSQFGPRSGNLDHLIGEPLPEVTVYDAEGKPFELGQLNGNYSVLVFGCLT